MDEDALVERITGRFTCADLQHALSRPYKQPKVAGTCDVCGSHEFKRRADDNEETVRTRMAEYRAKTAPILPDYEAQGIVRRVDGMAGVDDGQRAIDAAISAEQECGRSDGGTEKASVAVVGAGDYIGGAIARRFAAEGYQSISPAATASKLAAWSPK